MLCIYSATPATALTSGDYDYATNDSVEGVLIQRYHGYGVNIEIPSLIAGKPVTDIGDGAFSYNTRLTSVTIPDSVTWIGPEAFLNCTALTSITIPRNVTFIGLSAFGGCSSLTSIVVNAGNTAFTSVDGVLYSKPMTSLFQYPGGRVGAFDIPINVKFIESRAFEYCTHLTSVTIPINAEYIGMNTFAFCTHLTSVTIPNSVSTIGDYAFSYCSSLNSVTIGNGVVDIHGAAFYRCVSLASVALGSSITSIEEGVFYDCHSLTSVMIPRNVTAIGDYAFVNCVSLTAIDVSADNPNYASIDGALYNKVGTRLIQCPGGKTGAISLPGSVASFYPDAFRNCIFLTAIEVSVVNPNYTSIDGVLYNKTGTTLIQCPGGRVGTFTIPSNVTSIGTRAFNVCGYLTSVIIPSNVTSIEYSAFFLCTNLTQLYFEGNAPECGQMWFTNYNSDLVTVYFFGNKTGFTTPTWNGIRSVSLPIQSSPQDIQFVVILAAVAIFALLMVAFVIMRKHKVKK